VGAAAQLCAISRCEIRLTGMGGRIDWLAAGCLVLSVLLALASCQQPSTSAIETHRQTLLEAGQPPDAAALQKQFFSKAFPHGSGTPQR